MKSTQELYKILSEQFGEEAFELVEDVKVAPWIIVAPEKLQQTAGFLRDEPGLRFDSLMCLSGVHYDNDNLLGVTYHLCSTTEKHKLTLKVILPSEHAHVPSIEQVWKTANWHEREAFDMFGIHFDEHPDLRRILCPDDWEGYPLRKDYQVQEFYRGMKVEY
ncbi:MAG: NADH-quinone oxidoreductase subunit C [Balneolales bacterium]